MQLKNVIGRLALAASLATLGGCLVTAHARVAEPVAVVEVDEEPPAPRVWITETRPGFVYIQGRWNRVGNQWAWRDGYWERERAGYAWEQGRWDTRGNHHVWVEGGWRAGGAARGPEVRDHRANPPPPAEGPIVRDHR